MVDAALLTALDEAERVLGRLDATCCVPERSPRMAALRETIGRVRAAAADRPGEAALLLEEAGGQVGSLQVACCAPKRLPLYTEMLHQLTTARLALDGAMH